MRDIKKSLLAAAILPMCLDTGFTQTIIPYTKVERADERDGGRLNNT